MEKMFTAADFDTEVLGSDKPVLVDFFATWCGPCKMLTPAVERAAGQHPEVHFYKVDIDEEPDLANRFQIMSVPTLLFIKRGQVISKTVGVISSQELEKEIENGK